MKGNIKMSKCVYMSLKMNKNIYCKFLKKDIPINYCIGCIHKQYKNNKPSKRTEALSIPKKTKLAVWERDNHRCIFCKTLVPWYLANSHLIKRSHGGLGIEQNILTNCYNCHKLLDDSIKRKEMYNYALRYLTMKYNDFNIDDLTYKKR